MKRYLRIGVLFLFFAALNCGGSSPHVISGDNWTQRTAAAQFPARQDFTVLVFSDKLWVIGGSNSETIYSDVWYSADGVTWTEATASAAFGKRFAHAAVVFDGKMWVIGGVDENSESKNDVWFSADGATWTEATADAGFPARYAHSSTTDGYRMWVIAGRSGDTDMNDVWSSADGVTWSEATASAEFSVRQDHSSVYFNDKIWVIGGINMLDEDSLMLDDVWYSSDGATWTNAAAGAFEGRDDMALVVASGKMWMLGGFMNPHDRINEVWSSTDGVAWYKVSTILNFTARCMLGGAYFSDRLWVIAGQTGPSTRVNDVWSSE